MFLYIKKAVLFKLSQHIPNNKLSLSKSSSMFNKTRNVKLNVILLLHAHFVVLALIICIIRRIYFEYSNCRVDCYNQKALNMGSQHWWVGNFNCLYCQKIYCSETIRVHLVLLSPFRCTFSLKNRFISMACSASNSSTFGDDSMVSSKQNGSLQRRVKELCSITNFVPLSVLVFPVINNLRLVRKVSDDNYEYFEKLEKKICF